MIQKYIIFSIVAFLFIGCGQPRIYNPSYSVEDNMKIDSTLIISIIDFPKYNQNVFTRDEIFQRTKAMYFMSARGAAKETLKRGYTHFLLMNENKNTINGFSLNNMEMYFEYCYAGFYNELTRDSDLNGKICPREEWKVMPINTPPYQLFAFDAKKVLSQVGEFDKSQIRLR